MLKLKHKTSLLYASFAQESSQDFHFPLFAAIAIQVLSHLHTICLILISSFSVSSLQHYSLLPVLRDITCMTAIFPYFNYESLDTMIQAFYAVLICYFVGWIGMLAYNLFSVTKKREISIRVKQGLTLAFLIHSRVIFFPIHYLVLVRISAVTNCDESTTCTATKLPIPIIMGILNMSIAFCKEISFYHITKGKSAFSCKNNHVSLILLIQKTVITFLFAFFSDSVVATRLSAIINFVIFASLIAILYFKLPFYEMSLTQTSMAFSGISLVISFMSILKSCGALKDKSTVELILYLTSVLVVRVLLKFLQNLMFKILQFEYYTPEQAVHFPILIKAAFANSSPFPKNQKNFSQKTISYLGLLKIQGIDLESETNIQYEIYTVVLEKFLKLLKKYPHSEVLRICMANIYLKKLKTGVKAVSLLRTIRVFSRSIPVKNSVETYVKRIEETFIRYTQEGPNHLNVLNYFKYRDSAISMKESIQNEVSHHIDFWKELTQEKVDIFKMINTAQKVNDKFLHIHKLWNTFIEEFDSHFGALTLLYGVYLQTVRDLPHEGWPIITDYFHHRRNKALNKANRVLNILSENAAIIVGSIETEKLGRVIDSSVSVKSLFNIAKEKLIDQKVDILMPSLIAKRHDDFIHAYNKSPRLQMNTNMISLGRTIDGYFFSVEVTLKAFPFLQNGVCVIAFVEKTANREPMFVVGDKGVIVDSSKEIEGFFKVDKSILSKSKIQQFSNEFENILNAFNVSYNYSEKDGEVQSPTTNPTSFRDMHDDKNITLDPTSSRNFHEVETTDDQPLLESMLLSPPRSRRGTWKFSDAHLISPRRHFQLLANRASLMTRLTVDIQPKSSVRLPRDIESVIELCNKYKEGAKMALTSVYSVDLEARQGKQYFVKVEPLFVGKSFYKVVKIREVTGVTSIEALPASPRRNNLNFRASAIVKTEFKDDDSFADCFPQTSEKVVISQVKREEPREKDKDNETERKNCNTSLQMGYNSKGGGILAIRGDSSDMEFGQNQSQHNNHDNRVRNKPNEISSVKDSSSVGVRIAKTLNELFSNEKVRPATKLAIFVVYFAMLTVIAMSVVDYVFAGRSINEMQAAVLIKNTVNKRLFNSVIAWQYLLLIYTSAAPFLLDTIQDNVFEQTIAMLQQNDILKTSLQDMTNQRIVDIFFEKRVTMYDPTTQTVFNSEPMNALTAVSVLSVKNLIATNYSYTSASKAIKALQANPEIIFAINNTANDYFVVSEQELVDTEEVIDSILLKNIQLLELILGFENLALFLLAFLLAVLVKVVITSHSKAFKALISIHQQSVHKKLNNLKIFSDYLQENIEAKKFGYNLSLYLESLDKAAKNPQAKLSHVRYSEDKLVHKGLIIHMLRYLGFAFLFIFGVSGIFIYSFIASQKSFDLLDSLNDNLSTTHDIGYKVNSILSNFCHLTVFYNRTDLPLRNNKPDDEITIEFQYLTTANSVLLDNLVYPDIGIPDPVIASFLRNDICSFFTDRGDRLLCLDASKDSPGLLSLNAKYIQLAMSAVQDFRDLPTQANGQKTFNDFADDTTSDILTLQTSYEFLTARLLKQFQEKTQTQKDHRLAIFIGILIFISAITMIIHLIPINTFKKVDIVLRRVLKIIPYEIIKENKVFGFFLVNEFDKEVEGIKRYL